MGQWRTLNEKLSILSGSVKVTFLIGIFCILALIAALVGTLDLRPLIYYIHKDRGGGWFRK